MNQDLVNQVGEFTARVITLEAEVYRLNGRIDTLRDSLYKKIEDYMDMNSDWMQTIEAQIEEK